jgi:hypothetical protein
MDGSPEAEIEFRFSPAVMLKRILQAREGNGLINPAVAVNSDFIRLKSYRQGELELVHRT